MNEITFKIASRGEGKTKWLLNIAHSLKNESIKLYTETSSEYAIFCEKYFRLYNEVCLVKRLDKDEINADDVILIDNMLETNINFNDLKYINRSCKKIYATLEGNIDTQFDSFDSSQISIFDSYEVQLNG